MVRRFIENLLGGPKARRSIEITVQDQWVLKVLLRGDRWVPEEAIIDEATMERPTLIAHELVASILKLQLVGYIEADGEGNHRITKRGRQLKGIIPDWPGVNIEYCG